MDVEKTFATLLDTRPGEDTRVRHFAMRGFGVDQMGRCDRQQAPPAQPDLAIVASIDGELACRTGPATRRGRPRPVGARRRSATLGPS